VAYSEQRGDPGAWQDPQADPRTRYQQGSSEQGRYPQPQYPQEQPPPGQYRQPPPRQPYSPGRQQYPQGQPGQPQFRPRQPAPDEYGQSQYQRRGAPTQAVPQEVPTRQMPAPGGPRSRVPSQPPYPGQHQAPYEGGRGTRARQQAVAPDPLGGAEGNERLTVMTGTVLLILLAAEGFTILSIRQMLTLHFFLGMLLLGPVILKACSVTYRFFRYYTGKAPYRRKGPPAPLLRLLGPFIMLLTAGVFGSGVMLAVAGPAGRQPWLLLHKASFVLWFCAMAIHVLAYLPRLPRLLSAEARGVVLPEGHGSRAPSRAAQLIGGRRVRLMLLLGSLALGLVIAVLTVHLAGRWETLYF
jgi:hypothetical protein